MTHATIGDVDSAKSLYQEALKIWRAEKNLFSQASTLNNLAVLYHQLGEYEYALEAYEDGLACARNSHNQHAEALLLAGLGDLYCEIEDFEAASQAYEHAGAIVGGLSGLESGGAADGGIPMIFRPYYHFETGCAGNGISNAAPNLGSF